LGGRSAIWLENCSKFGEQHATSDVDHQLYDRHKEKYDEVTRIYYEIKGAIRIVIVVNYVFHVAEV
jgi:hypothetical protein